jgi:hypothetical protein
MSPRLPFDVAFDVVAPFENAPVHLELEMAGEDGLDETVDMLACLVSLTQLGVFAADDVGRPRPGASWTARGEPTGERWQGELLLHSVGISFWRVLLQMCTQCHHHMAPIAALRIRDRRVGSAARRVDGLTLGQALQAPYPGPPARPPFRLIRRESHDSGIVLLRLTTSSPIDDAALAGVRQGIEDWGSLIYVGGFADAGQPMDEYHLDRVDVGLIHPTLVEAAFVGWNSQPAALDGLVTVCAGLSRAVVPVEELELE